MATRGYFPDYDLDLSERKFRKDVRFGEAREASLAEALAHGTIEHKADLKAQQTGNVYVEFEQRSRANPEWHPSGIELSTANFWAFEVSRDIRILVPTATLRKLVALARRRDMVRQGGDEPGTRGALLPIGWLVRPPADVVSALI